MSLYSLRTYFFILPSGLLLTCRKGVLESDKKVDKEFSGLFTVLDENESWLLDKNIKEYCSDSWGVVKDDEGFKESNKMHAINGYFYGNLPGLDMCLGDSVRWHLAGIGNEVDIHTGKIVEMFISELVTIRLVEQLTRWLIG